ncbi:hypothetical protein CRN46_07570, partial [Vibrio vulnificus]
FWYAVSFCGESGLRKVGLGGIHPLTQRMFNYVKSAACIFSWISNFGFVGKLTSVVAVFWTPNCGR